MRPQWTAGIVGTLSKRQRTPEELQEQLIRQRGFLRSRGEAFDAGNIDEAWALSPTVRVLVHQTDKSSSLLGQLQLQGQMRFLDTGSPVADQWFRKPDGSLTQSINMLGAGLLYIKITDDLANWYPRLDTDPGTWSRIPFEKWWNQPILRSWSRPNRLWTRRTLVLALANKDGGAHVDPDIDEDFDCVLRRHAGRYIIAAAGGQLNVQASPVPPSVRQISYELEMSITETLGESCLAG